MNLTEQQKQIGKENFDEAVAISRRDFLAGTVAAGVATGAGLGSIYFGYGRSVGDPLRVGVIGTGDEGSVLIGRTTPSISTSSRSPTSGPTTCSARSTATSPAPVPTRPVPA